MPPESALFHAAFLACLAGSVIYHPMFGVAAYLLTYHINPAAHWWGLSALSYSFLSYVTISGSLILHFGKLKYENLLESQEVLLLSYLATIWLSLAVGIELHEGKEFAEKMSKVVVMQIMVAHIVTDLDKFRKLSWIYMIAGVYLGYEMYNAPYWMFFTGRFHSGIGGTDFNEGNFLGIHFATILPFYGIAFIKGNFKAKAIALVGGVLALNSIILIRSRGCFLSIIGGSIVAFLFPGPLKRSYLIVLFILGFAGMFFLTDANFWQRMGTIETEKTKMDSSAQGRVAAWKASILMVEDYPAGVGAGNFARYVGNYDPTIPGKDTHNTYFRALGELGLQGFTIIIMIVCNAFATLLKAEKESGECSNCEELSWYILAVKILITIQFIGSLTLTHTYVECYFWVMMMPVFLLRVVQNQKLMDKQEVPG